ncbi:MAG: porin [Rhodocyclaceae bacterium]|nr:porin [Rhodocyclaceae bacterium]
MKKSLVALAALAVAGVASAQSSVTLFGIVDASVSGYSTKSNLFVANPFVLPAFGLPGSLKRSQTALANSGYNSSRIGFRGTEDLGGGLAASFWLESGISNDDGQRGIYNFNRRSTVSLSGGFGEIRLGRDYTPTFWNDTVFDPFGTNGVGTNVISTFAGNLATAHNTASTNPVAAFRDGDNYVRTSNSIGYFLPPNLGGFYGQVQYALHENVKSDWIQGSPSKRGRYVGGRFGYANGPLDVAIAYGEDTKDPATPALVGLTSDKIKTLNLGASYDFGPVKLFGELSQIKDKTESSTAVTLAGLPYYVNTGATDKYNGALIGVTVPVGAGLIRASYSKVKYNAPDPVTFSFFNTNRDASASKFAIGYVHNLSKRTALYATVARISLKDAQNNGVIAATTTGGSPTFGTSFNGGVYVPKTATGYDFGIRHSF